MCLVQTSEICFCKCLSGLVDKQACVANGFVIGICPQCRAQTFDLKQVIVAEYPGNVYGNRLWSQFFDDKKIDTVAVLSQNIFFIEFQKRREVNEFDFYGTGNGLMPVN